MLTLRKYFCIFSPFDVDKVVFALTGGGIAKPATGVLSSKTRLYQTIGCLINLLDLHVSLNFLDLINIT